MGGPGRLTGSILEPPDLARTLAKTPVHTAALKVSKIVTIIKMMMTGMIVDGAR